MICEVMSLLRLVDVIRECPILGEMLSEAGRAWKGICKSFLIVLIRVRTRGCAAPAARR